MVTQPELCLKFKLCDDKLELFGDWFTCGNSVFSCSNYERCWWTNNYEQLPDTRICWLCLVVAVVYHFPNWKCAEIFSILVSQVCLLEGGVIDWELLHRITGRSGSWAKAVNCSDEVKRYVSTLLIRSDLLLLMLLLLFLQSSCVLDVDCLYN